MKHLLYKDKRDRPEDARQGETSSQVYEKNEYIFRNKLL